MEPETIPNKKLDLTYEEYLKNGKSIADTRLDKYLIYEKLDKGAFGTVYRGMDDITKKEVAVKVIDLASIQRDEKSPKVREIRKRLAQTQSQMMKMVDSPHIMKLWDVYQNEHLKILVIQFCNGGTLSDMIYRRQRIPEKQAIQILKQIIFGVAEMHKHNIIHRDIKSENIMSHNGVFKLVDLGFAKMLPSNSDIFTGTILGTIITMAPEVMRRKPYGVKADIWSLGVIFYEMIFGKIPFEPMKAPDMYEQIVNKEIFPQGGRVNGVKPSPEIIALMKQILVIDQDYRMSWEQLIDHKLFKVNKQKLPDEFRVTVNLEDLKKSNLKVESKTEDQRLNELTIKKLDWPQLEPIKISRLSRKEKDKKIQEIDQSDKKILQHSKEYYLECLKTEYILKEIIQPIEQQKVFDLDDRDTVQLLYLLSSRCYCNMSNIRFNINQEKHQVINIINKTVKSLYNVVTQKFNFYCQKLKQIQDKVSSIIGDRFQNLFNHKNQKIKDQFLGGIEVQRDQNQNNGEKAAGYTKQEQIVFTYETYIVPMTEEKKKKKQYGLLIKKLQAYKQINRISQQEIEHAKFFQLVDKILEKIE